MKKTISINLGKQSFYIDEDAYQQLQKYLSDVEKSLGNTQGKYEILGDIESRISELFNEKLNEYKTVIDSKDVDNIINVLGNPDVYLSEDEESINQNNNASYSSEKKKYNKRLYRNSDDAIVSGVCSGLGAYFGMDPIIFRVAFPLLSVFSWGGFIVLYAILWAATTEARSTSEKLNMKGEPINLSSIKENFNTDSFNNLSKDVSKYGGQTVSVLAKFLKIAIKIFLIVILSSFILSFLGLILSMLGVLVLGFNVGESNLQFLEFSNLILAESWMTPLAVISAFTLIIVPFVSLILLCVRLFNKKRKVPKAISLSMTTAWILAFVSTLFLVALNVKDITQDSEVEVVETLATLNKKAPITLKVNENDFSEMSLSDDKTRLSYSNDFDIHISATQDSVAYMNILKSANANRKSKASERADNINFNYQINQNTITFDDFIDFPYIDKLRGQEAKIDLYIPIGTEVLFGKKINRYIDYGVFNQNIYKKDHIENERFIMTANGLECQDCLNKDFKSTKRKKTTLYINGKSYDLNQDFENLDIDLHDDRVEDVLEKLADEIGFDLEELENSKNIDLKIIDDGNLIELNANKEKGTFRLNINEKNTDKQIIIKNNNDSTIHDTIKDPKVSIEINSKKS